MALGVPNALFERSSVPGSLPDDLDMDAVRAFIHLRAERLLRQGSLEEAAVRVGILARSGTTYQATVTGLCLFGHQPQLFFPQWGLAVVRLNGLSLACPVAQRIDLEGPLPHLVDQAMEALEGLCRLGNEPQADIGAEYARLALREVLLNALIHRDLRLSGRVTVRVFDDRIEVWSPGGAHLGNTSLEELTQAGGLSLPPNVMIATAARVLGLGEQLGRGMVLLKNACARFTSLPVELSVGANDVLVSLPSATRHPGDNPQQLS